MNVYIFSSQAGEGSTGSGSSGGGGGSSFSMKGSSRQRSPGTVIRMGDAMDEPSSSNPNTAEPDEFVPNIHPPTDDEGVRVKMFSVSTRIN